MKIEDLNIYLNLGLLKLQGHDRTAWERKFIWFKKINDRWIFMRFVWRRINLVDRANHIQYEYATNDLELIAES
jgi:hypothetical protein